MVLEKNSAHEGLHKKFMLNTKFWLCQLIVSYIAYLGVLFVFIFVYVFIFDCVFIFVLTVRNNIYHYHHHHHHHHYHYYYHYYNNYS